MSTYYEIQGLKVRVSDHEPNFSMDRQRGLNDIEFYTRNIENKRMSIVDQVQNYCDRHDVDISLFAEVIRDYPDPEVQIYEPIAKIEVTQEIVDGYRAIRGKGSMKKQERYCAALGIDEYYLSQGKYIIK